MYSQGRPMKLIRGVIKTVLRKRSRARLALAGARPQPRGNDLAALWYVAVDVATRRHNITHKK